MKYTKRQVEVEAIQFEDTAERLREISEFLAGEVIVNHTFKRNPFIPVRTTDGVMQAEVGDWIIKDGEGNISVYKPEDFGKAYFCSETYVDRMRAESFALSEKIYKLRTYIHSPHLLSDGEDLLCAQLGAMEAYWHILERRIKMEVKDTVNESHIPFASFIGGCKK